MKRIKYIFLIMIMSLIFIPISKVKANYLYVNNTYTVNSIVNEELPTGEDLDAYVAEKKSEFEDDLQSYNVDKTKSSNIDYNTLFGTIGEGTYTHKYAVIKDVSSEYAMIEGNLTQIFTITYDKYVLKTGSDGHVLRKTRSIEHTVVEGKLTISGTDSYTKDYVSAEKDAQGKYIESQYFLGDKDVQAVQDKVQEIKDDMDAVAATYYTTVSSKIAGYVEEYYVNAHDEVTSEGNCPAQLTNLSEYPGCTLVITTVIDRFRTYKVTGSATTKNISTLDVTLSKPVAGTEVNKIEDTSIVCIDPSGCYTQDYLPTVSTNNSNVTLMSRFVNDADYNSGTNSYDIDLFEGEISRDGDIQVYISISTKNGYKIKNDAVITVNGEEPERVFPVIEDNQVVGLVAKIKSEVKTKRYTLDDELGNTISFLEDEGIVFAFSTTDFSLLTDEELEAAGASREELDALLNSIQEAVKKYGTLITAYQFHITDSINDLHEAKSKFRIRIKMTEEMKKYNQFYIVYVDDNNNTEDPIKLTVNGDYLEGDLLHLSGYALVGNVVEVSKANPGTSDNICNYFILLGVSLVGLLVVRKRRIN